MEMKLVSADTLVQDGIERDVAAEPVAANGDEQGQHKIKVDETAEALSGIDNLSTDTSSVDTSDLSDETSSSSDSSSDDSDGDSAPEEMTSKRLRPDRVPPPPRKHKNPCHQFVKTGRCRRGENCRYSHEIPDKTRRATKDAGSEPKRPSLFQMLVDQQKEDEARRVMQAIAWLGERGMLDERAAGEGVAGGEEAAKG
ncbi:predicted protein [Uncinocarpus reesii 1704]|uniref:C3H1-type domain-containing protein n=1 Tax=Uncinocarpus reesii (strain UAMH 1704) TaxID=336963 RepID=C4JIG9_UNCRE|nr:uncharacterized protein UREG_01506 [Uncinocarpus reesii 1704]EEP76657.1 predicted protein [Uncinocarpus reesii 1704]